MPTNKRKRKAATQSNRKHKGERKVKSPGLVTTYPTAFLYLGFFLIATGLYIFITEFQNSAKFGFAMILILFGIGTAITAKLALPEKHEDTKKHN